MGGVRVSLAKALAVACCLAGPAKSALTAAADPPTPRPTHPPAVPGRPPHSWATLPVFFHSSNISGPWSDAAVRQIARYPLATNEKSHAMRLPNGSRQSEEVAGPAACRQVAAENTGTSTFFYLNSIIDYDTNFKLHALMVANPGWRLKNHTDGGDLTTIGTAWGYNLTVPEMRAAWVAECVTATEEGCTGCFIDQANVAESVATWPPTSAVNLAYRAAHLAALSELAEALAPKGKYSIFNHLGVTTYKTTTMMIEDFAATEKCIETLQTIASRGLTVEAHVGALPAETTCEHGDTNALAAFLIAAGEYSYYHCNPSWGSDPRWPAVADGWLDW